MSAIPEIVHLTREIDLSDLDWAVGYDSGNTFIVSALFHDNAEASRFAETDKTLYVLNIKDAS